MRLRADVELRVSDQETVLHDPVFGRRVQLGPESSQVAQKLDGQPLETLAASLGMTLERVENAVRTLLHLNLVEGAGVEVIERAKRLASGKERLGRIILSGAQFGCVGSGDCCQSYHFGPLAEADLKLLDSLPIAEKFPHLEAPYTYERLLRADGTDKAHFLRAIDGRCLFLLDDCKCGLHANFGYANKPGLCRYFPFEPMATLDGVQISDKGGCSAFATTARSGRPLAEQLPELWPLMPQELPLNHPVVLLDASTPVDFSYLQPLLSAAIDELEGTPPAGAPEMLRAFGRRCRALSQSLNHCQMDPLAPRRLVETLVAGGPEPFLQPAGENDLRAAGSSLSVVTHELQGMITAIIGAEHAESSNFYSGRQSKEILPILHLLGELGRHLGEGAPLSDYLQKLAAVSVDEPEADQVLHISLRNQLFGHGALIGDRVEPALLRHALVQLSALWGGRVRALADGRSRVKAEDLSRGHMLMMRIPGWRGVERVLMEEVAHAPVIVEALPELARWSTIQK